MAITPGVVGPTRSDVSMEGVRNINQAAQQSSVLFEQRRQYNIMKGMESVLNGADIATVLMTDEGKAALAPFVGQLTGMSGGALSTYMDQLAASPRTTKALFEQMQVGELLDLTRLTPGAVPGQAKAAPQPGVPAVEASFTPPAQAPTSRTDVRTPPPAPTDAGAFNADELQALNQFAQKAVIQIQGVDSSGNPIPYTPEPGGIDIRSTGFASQLLPGQVFPTREEAQIAVRAKLAETLTKDTPAARMLWAQLTEGAARQGMTRPEGRRQVAMRADGDTSVPRYGPSTGRTFDEFLKGTAHPAAAGGAAPAGSFKQFLLDWQARTPESQRPEGYKPISASGTWTDEQYAKAAPALYREYLASGGKPVGPAQGSAAAGTVGAGTLLPQDRAVAAAAAPAAPELVRPAPVPATPSGRTLPTQQVRAPVTPQEKRAAAESAASAIATTRREWRATPGLRGAAAASGERISMMLEKIAPGVDAAAHPALAELRVNWADLTKRKTEAEIDQALAEAGLKKEEAKYYKAKLLQEAAATAVEQLQVTSETYAKALGEARQAMTTLYAKDFERLAAITDPQKRADAEAELMKLPVFKNLWLMTVDGLAQLSGNALTVDFENTVKKGWFGIITGQSDVPYYSIAGASLDGVAPATGDEAAAAQAAGYSYGGQ